MYGRGIDARRPIGQAHVFSAALFGGFHQAHDLGQQGVFTGGGHAHLDRGRQVQGPGIDRIARIDRTRQAFTRDQRGIQVGHAGRDFAVGGQALARSHGQDHAGLDIVGGDGAAFAVGLDHHGGRGPQAEQARCRRPGLVACPAIQVTPDQQEEQQGHRSVEIGVLGPLHGLLQAHPRGQDHGQGNRHIHVQGARRQSRRRRAKERHPGIDHGGQGDQRRDPMEQVAGRVAHAGKMPGPDRNRQQHNVGRREPGHGHGFQ